MTNRQRIQLAHKAILASHANHSSNPHPEEALRDLVADLWHYADYHGLDFRKVCDGAALHHDVESKWGLDDHDYTQDLS